MNKSKMLSAYKTVNNLKADQSKSGTPEDQLKPLYRSEYDEKLIKEYHFAKFKKNLDLIQNSPELSELLEKEEWDEDDIKKLLATFR